MKKARRRELTEELPLIIDRTVCYSLLSILTWNRSHSMRNRDSLLPVFIVDVGMVSEERERDSVLTDWTRLHYRALTAGIGG